MNRSGDCDERSSSRFPGQASPLTPGITAAPPSGHPTPAALSTCSLLSATPCHNDTDNRGPRYDPTVTGLQNLGPPDAEPGKNWLRRGTLFRRGLALDRQELPAGAEQPGGPADQTVEGSDSAGSGDGGPELRGRLVLSPGSHHGGV